MTTKSATASLLSGGLPSADAPSTFGISSGPVKVETLNFPLQSFPEIAFAEDTAKPPAQGLLPQSPGEPLVKQASKIIGESGFGLALGPDADFPAAIRFHGGPERSGSHPIILRPGEKIFPFGREKSFEGFEVGVPQGWMGGGWGALHVLKSKTSDIHFGHVEKEVLFHRLQLRIRVASAEAPLVNGYFPANWPMQFPWPKAYRGMYLPGTTTFSGRVSDQNGQPTVGLRKATRTLMRLNGGIALTGALIAGAPDNFFRIVWWGTDHFEIQQDGVRLPIASAISSQNFFLDQFWPANGAVLATMPAHNPILAVPTDFAAQKAQIYGISLEAPEGSPLIDATVDVLRYGIL